MFAAASAAYRMNGNRYVKYNDLYDNKQGRTNKSLLLQCIADPEIILPADYTSSKIVQRFCEGLTLKMLKQGSLSSFDSQLLDLVSADAIAVNDSGVLAYAPHAATLELQRETTQDLLGQCEQGYYGRPGGRIETTVEVVSCHYSRQWNTYYLQAITSCNHRVFFPYKSQLSVNKKYSITAKVKDHAQDFTTKLHYVKLDKNSPS